MDGVSTEPFLENPVSEDASSLPPHLQDLNPEQLEAVRHFRGPILILAGAGSGKTRVLTRRVVHLVLEHGVSPHRILAVTFTNKATAEMRERLQKTLGEDGQKLWVSTFHSAALRILRRHATLLGYPSSFSVYDEDDSQNVIKQVMKELNITDKKFTPGGFSKAIDQAKNSYLSPEQYAATRKDYFSQMVAEVYDRYQRTLLASQAMDFGDLLVNVVRLFQKHPDVLASYQRGLEFVLVDEFQDTNKVQYLFIRMITAHHRNLLVVGDDDQSIYAFRGATIRNILDFERDFPDTRVIKLEQNYRSTQSILGIANTVIDKNTERKAKKLWTSNGAGDLIRAFVAEDDSEEAEYIANEILALHAKGTRFSDIAIFYRTNAQSRALEEACTYRKIPYRIFGGLRFYDRKEIKDIIAYLRLLVTPGDAQAFLRVVNTPPRGLGAQAVESVRKSAAERSSTLMEAARELAGHSRALADFVQLIDDLRAAAATTPLSQLIELIMEKSTYLPKLEELAKRDFTAQSRVENLRELVAIGRSMELDVMDKLEIIREFLDRVTLASSADIPTEGKEGNATGKGEFVSFMTLHLAKGLEFPVVFLTGLEEGLLPHYKAAETPSGVEEERRLCYVGMTRAMRLLYLTRAIDRGMFAGNFSGGFSRKPSRFIFDLDPQYVEGGGKAFFEEPAHYQLVDEDRASWSDSDGSTFRRREPRTERPRERSRPDPLMQLTTADKLAFVRAGAESGVKPAKADPPFGPKLEEVQENTKVSHPAFGQGVIVAIEPDPRGNPLRAKLIVQFGNDPKPKKLVISQSRITVL